MYSRGSGLQVPWLSSFFQAEAGIRYSEVTGVQTCALPISLLLDRPRMIRKAEQLRDDLRLSEIGDVTTRVSQLRSEERRVGKEGRTGGRAQQCKTTVAAAACGWRSARATGAEAAVCGRTMR